MEINELNKKQLVLLTLLITFIVSIATGIVTVSLMQQIPTSVPQTINNVIQKTIERVTTVEVPISNENINNDKQNGVLVGDGDALVPIYAFDESLSVTPLNTSDTDIVLEDNSSVENTNQTEPKEESIKALGMGVIISDVGLILVESNILQGHERYKVVLDKTEFPVSILKKFDNGFTILKILTKQEVKDQEAKTEITL